MQQFLDRVRGRAQRIREVRKVFMVAGTAALGFGPSGVQQLPTKATPPTVKLARVPFVDEVIKLAQDCRNASGPF